MVRTAIRCLVLLLACLAGCAAPLQHRFPLNQPGRPPAVAAVSWNSTLVFTDGRMLCSAVLVAPDTALTARHCLLDGFNGGVLAHPDGRVFGVVQAVVASDADIAFLRILPAAREPAPLGEVVEVGQAAHVLGYGCSSGVQLEARPVRFVGRFKPSRPDDLLLDVWEGRACRGDSGGGVFDAEGRLLGISVRIADVEDGEVELVYTVPAELVAALVR